MKSIDPFDTYIQLGYSPEDDVRYTKILFDNLIEQEDFCEASIKFILTFTKLTEEQIRELGEFILWPELCKYQKLSEDFIRENKKYVIPKILFKEGRFKHDYSKRIKREFGIY